MAVKLYLFEHAAFKIRISICWDILISGYVQWALFDNSYLINYKEIISNDKNHHQKTIFKTLLVLSQILSSNKLRHVIYPFPIFISCTTFVAWEIKQHVFEILRHCSVALKSLFLSSESKGIIHFLQVLITYILTSHIIMVLLFN